VKINSTGIYFVTVISGKITATKKIVVEEK
jgi:hypothetical protein